VTCLVLRLDAAHDCGGWRSPDSPSIAAARFALRHYCPRQPRLSLVPVDATIAGTRCGESASLTWKVLPSSVNIFLEAERL
jgi:hypothetical protein